MPALPPIAVPEALRQDAATIRAKVADRTRLMDVLRGLLASWVVLHHVVLLSGLNPNIYPWRLFIRHGQEPVLVFFALSGFAITRSLWARPQRWLSFLIARVWRIYPVYLIALAIGLAVTVYGEDRAAVFNALTRLQIAPWALDEGVPRIPHILLHLLQLHGLAPAGWLPHVDTSLVAPGWSLSTEFQFYLLAPLLGVVLLRPWENGNLAPGLILMAAGLWPYVTGNPLIAPANVLRYLDLFLLGMTGAVMHDSRPFDRLGYSALAGLVALAGWQAGQMIVVTAIGVWLLFWWSSPLAAVNRLIDRPAGQLWLLIGALSYPLYIIHYPIARLLLTAGAELSESRRIVFVAAWAPATVAASYAAAALLHRYVELPGTHYGKRIAKRREQHLDRRMPTGVKRGRWCDPHVSSRAAPAGHPRLRWLTLARSWLLRLRAP